MSAPILFFDIAGTDADKLGDFYERLFGWSPDEGGQFAVNVTAPLRAAIRADPAEKRIYIGVDDVDAKLAEVEEHGGSVDTPRFEVPGVVVLGLFKDPAGNSMGLVEIRNGEPKVP